MRSNLYRIQRRLPGNLRKDGTPVLLQWSQRTGGTPDPVTGHPVGGSVATQSATHNALVHDVNVTAGLRQFQEIEEGMLILDFLPDAPLDGKPGLRLQVATKWYELAPVTGKLAQAWDAIVRGQRLLRRVLVKPIPEA